MPDDPTRAELARLRAEFAAFRARTERRRRPLARRLAAIAVVALLAALIPCSLLAAGPFSDLNSGSPHNENIAAIQAAGITKGCNPPDFTAYCPNGNVTREEMASFLARTAGLGTNPPVANAATLQGRAANTFGRAAAAKQEEALSTAGGVVDTVAVNIVAPAPGYVLVSGATELFANTCDTANSNCNFQTFLRHTGTSDQSPILLTILGGIGRDTVDTASPTWVFPVAAGPQTFTLAVRQTIGPAQAALLLNNQISALYVPFGPDGNTP